MNFNQCVMKHKLHTKLATADLETSAAEFQAQGMTAGDAMIRAVSEALEMAQMHERQIVSTVRAAYEAKGGKKRPAPATPAKGKAAAAARAAELADYFKPGNVVNGYIGHDRVLEYTPAADGGFSVKVQHVVKTDAGWEVAPGAEGRERSHSTMPDAAALKAGPVERAPAPTSPQSNRVEYPPSMGNKTTHDGQIAVVDFMNGDIAKPELIDKLGALDLYEGVIRSITNRTEDFTNGDVQKVVAIQQKRGFNLDDEAPPAKSKQQAAAAEKPAPEDKPESFIVQHKEEFNDAPETLIWRMQNLDAKGTPAIIVTGGGAALGGRYTLYEPGNRSHFSHDWRALQGESSGEDAVKIAMRYRDSEDIIAMTRAAKEQLDTQATDLESQRKDDAASRQKRESEAATEQANRTALREQLSKVKFNKQEVTIRTDKDKEFTVSAYVYKGLAIHKDHGGEGKVYQITHMNTGMHIGANFGSLSDAKMAAARLADSADVSKIGSKEDAGKPEFKSLRDVSFAMRGEKMWDLGDPLKNPSISLLVAEEAPAGETTKSAAPIADFGEKLEGAKKDLWKDYKKSIADALPEDRNEITMAKHFPEPNYEALLAAGVEESTLAAVKALRDEVPPKPRMPHKLRIWVGTLDAVRGFANDLLNGKLTGHELYQNMEKSSLVKYADRMRMYEQLGYPAFTRAKDYTLEEANFSMFEGKSPPGGVNKAVLQERGVSTKYFDNWWTGLDALKAKLTADPGSPNTSSARAVKLDLYRTTGSRDIIIGKKVGAGKFIDLKGGFQDVRSARTYLAEHQAELEALLEQKKDVRPERRSVNDPRVGEDRRKGADISPEQFGSTFGFRGVQFGNYVEQKRRGADLNNAYDALLDLADLIDVPPAALSLNGSMGLAFGARGAGGKNAPAAHFESGNIVINLTKNAGPGSLAHEWFHAFDNYFSRLRGKDHDFVTNDPNARKIAGGDDQLIRPEVLAAVKGVVAAINASGLPKRSQELDARRSKDYWGTTIELAARAFESYIIDKAAEKGLANDYLANILPENAHSAMNDLTGQSEPFPYPTRAEAPAINAAFDKLFETIESKKVDGREMLYSMDSTFYSALARALPDMSKIADKAGMVKPDQAAAWLTARQKEGRFKADELQWSGLPDWLALQEGKVSVDQIGEFVMQNGVQVQEVTKGEAQFNGTAFDEDSGTWGYADVDGVMVGLGFETEQQAAEAMRAETSYSPGTKYSQYQLPGGENYRELLLTLPTKNQTRGATDAELDALHERLIDAGADGLNEELRGALAAGGNDAIDTLDDMEARVGVDTQALRDAMAGGSADTQYRSRHWDEGNIVAHIRFNDRTDAEGNKVLFIEEMQSDWGQAGLKDGFRQAGQSAWDAFRAKGYSVAHEDNNENFDGPTWVVRDNRGDTVGGAPTEQEAIASFIRMDAGETVPQAFYESGVPRAPFVGKTEGWLQLGIKRMIRYAAENGYDKVAFVSGQQSADRYDLSKQVDSLRIVLRGSGHYTVWVRTPGADAEQRASGKEGVDADGLSNIVGKELADRAVKELAALPARDEDDRNAQVKYSGDGLKVGGEGMKSFYDKIVPQNISDVLKKLGAGKVEEVRLPNPEGDFKLTDTKTGKVYRFQTLDALEKHLEIIKSGEAQGYEMKSNSKDLIRDLDRVKISQPGFTVTPEMRDKAMGGLPLFSKDSTASPSDAAIATMIKDGTTVDKVLAQIEANSATPDNRVLATALGKQNLKTLIQFEEAKAGQKFTVGTASADNARGGYRPGDNTAILYREDGAEQTMLHELVHAATLRALQAGGLAATQIRHLWNYTKAQPAFAGQYGISNEEEFIAEAYANPAFRQLMRDTPAPGGKLSLWQRLMGIVRMILGKPGVDDNLLDRVMAAGADLMAENRGELANDTERANPGTDRRTRTIEVDGVRRPITNSRGQLLGQDFNSQQAFWKFFGDSAVVDDRGLPLVVYHGTASPIAEFNTGDQGAYFSDSPELASDYAENAGYKKRGDSPNVVPSYLSIRNPRIVEMNGEKFSDATFRKETSLAKSNGNDGLILRNVDDSLAHTKGKVSQVFVAFYPEQIKSATGNSGNFDTTNLDIRASIASAAGDAAALRLPAGYLVGDLFNHSGKLSWWHKTIGTMDNLARRKPAFAKVYESVQSFLGDVSRYAVVAADLAPTLLPKLENIRDVIGANRKHAVTAEDTKAIGAPIFEGTLTWARDPNGKPVKIGELETQADAMTTKQKASVLLQQGIIDNEQNKAWLGNPLDFYDSIINKKYTESQLKAGVVWTDAELASMFELNPDQIALYHEFRASIDKSLTNLTISEMIKLGGKDAKGMIEQAINAPDLQAAAELLRDHFVALARLHPEQTDMHLDTAQQIMNSADRGQDLMDRGYAPLSRFGKYSVYVEDGGEQVYFGMFETQHEASKMARQMRRDHPNAQVLHGTVSEEAYKLFAGVSPETIELFGSMVGLDAQDTDAKSTEVYQTYLKLAKNNRSAMKRMIQRKGIAGFNEDAGRVLAGFVYSNARLTAGNAHLGEVDEAITAIPKQQGELIDSAMQLREQIRNPQNGTKLGGLMFAQFLGGSVASAMVNLTQPFTMTLPYLSQWGGIGKAGARLLEAIKLTGKESTGDADLDAALKWATDEGIVAPQEVHYLMAQASGKGALQAGDGTKAGDARATLNNTMAKVQLGWGKLFAMAELTNRRLTFIAAYRTAVEEGKPNPAKFAQDAVTQTQGVYNSGNKPKWARSNMGGLLMTFKQYSIAYLELLSRMAFAGEPGSPERANGQRAALYMIAVLLLMSGADGIPFEQDLEDALDGIMQRLGYNFSTKRSKQAFLVNVLGEGGADFALKGLSATPGMPIDVAGRFGMGNLIPGTGLLTKKESYTRDLGELAGPAGDVALRSFTAAGKALGGDLAGAALDLSPAAVRNVAKGADMAATGSYNDARGYKVNDTSMTEAAMKAVGFQPSSTAAVQDAKGQALNMITQTRMESQAIAEHWAQGMAARDPAMIQEARDRLHDWNAKNPEAPVKVSMPGILKRVKAMKEDAIARTQKTAPKAIKAAVRAELAETR